MDKTLSTIYLQVKSETRTLTNSAIAQILVKIIYSKDHRLSFNEIVSLYKDFTKRKTVSEDILQEILTRLCSTDEIKLSVKNEYYITDSKRKQIKAVCESSRKRRENNGLLYLHSELCLHSKLLFLIRRNKFYFLAIFHCFINSGNKF